MYLCVHVYAKFEIIGGHIKCLKQNEYYINVYNTSKDKKNLPNGT